MKTKSKNDILIEILGFFIIIVFIATNFTNCNNGNPIIITIEPEGAGSVTITPNGDGTITLKAISNEGYRFYRWSGGYVGYINNCIVPENVDQITAHFSDFLTEETLYDFETGSLDGWTLGGDEAPHIQDNITPSTESNYAVQFGQIEATSGNDNVPLHHSQMSSMEINNLNLKAETIISFDYKVSSESGTDGLYFNVNAPSIDEFSEGFSGEVNWANYSYALTKNETYSLKWMYSKDGSNSIGLDCAWIDNVKIISLPPRPIISVFGTTNGCLIKKRVIINSSQEFKFYIKNIGKATLYLDDVSVNGNGFSISKQIADKELEFDETIDFCIRVNISTVGEKKTASVSIPNSDHENSPYYFNFEAEGCEAGNSWLIMMYVDGDNNLESHLWSDINEMELGLQIMEEAIRENVKVIALWDGWNGNSAPATSYLYELGPDIDYTGQIGSNPEPNDTLGPDTIELTNGWFTNGTEIDMGNGATLTSFINYCRTNYPNADYEVLIMSNHGGGVRTQSPMRYGWEDETNGSALYTNEMQQALINAGYGGATKLSLLGFDACYMGMVEEAYEYRNLANYLVASPESEQLDGWEFEEWSQKISFTTTPIQLSRYIVESYRDYVGASNQTMTAVDLSKMEALKTSIDNMSAKLHSYGTYSLIQNSDYIGVIASDIEDNTSLNPELRNSANAVLSSLADAIVYAWAGSNIHGGYDGTGFAIKDGLRIVTANELWYTNQPYENYGLIDFCTITNDGIINTWKELLSSPWAIP